MDDELRKRFESFLRPLYSDLDGVTRFDEIERIGHIARRLTPTSRELELLVLFHGLGNWLDKIGNLSRAVLTLGGEVAELELRRTSMAIRRLDSPTTDNERAVAAAIVIDRSGLRGLADRLARSRREGSSPADVARAVMEPLDLPSWMPLQAIVWTGERRHAAQDFCQRILDEAELSDLAEPEESASSGSKRERFDKS